MTDNHGEVVARYEPVFFEWQLSANDEGRYVLYTDHQSLLLAAREDHAKQSEYLCQKILEANIRAERAEAELAECRRIIASLVVEHPNNDRDGNAPGHAHDVPGIWDDDNGKLAGKPCAWCAIWKKATYYAAIDACVGGEG